MAVRSFAGRIASMKFDGVDSFAVARLSWANAGLAIRLTPRQAMRSPPAEIAAPVEDIDTPALIVDLEPFERNLEKMARVARDAGVRLRPHAKTHKCPEIAKRQIALGAVGQCVQKVAEAEALASAGIRDINEIVGASKLRRLARLGEDAKIALCFDDAEQVDAASRVAGEHGVKLGALVEIEV